MIYGCVSRGSMKYEDHSKPDICLTQSIRLDYSLVKSRGYSDSYHQHKTFKTPLPGLMVALNHSTQRQTLDYLCMQAKEQRDLYENEL